MLFLNFLGSDMQIEGGQNTVSTDIHLKNVLFTGNDNS